MRLTLPLSFGLVLLASGCARDLTLPLDPVRGQVTGIVDTQGRVRPGGHLVTITAASGARATALTAADGAFSFGELTPGAYALEFSIPGFAPFFRPAIQVTGTQVVELGTLSPVWLANTPQEALLSGRVVVQGGGDASGGQVDFVLEGVDQRVALAPIGQGGAFVQRLPPGSYTLRASHPLYVSAEQSGVVLGEGEVRDLAGSPLSLGVNPATLSGRVLREASAGEPLPAQGALVTLETGATTTTDATGAFQLQGLAGGEHVVQFSLSGHFDPLPARRVRLEPGGSLALGETLLKLNRGTVSGLVELSDRQIARDVTISLTGTPYTAVVSPSAAEPWKGSFQLANVPEGTYELSASKARYSRPTVGGVLVVGNRDTALAQPLVLTLLQGDFVIDDGDATNTSGFTATRQVSLDLRGFVGAARYRASEDPTFANVPFQPFSTTVQPFTLASGEGTHTVYAQYEDANGTASPTTSASIVLDTVAPTAPAVVINGGAGFTRQANPLVLTLDALEAIPAGVDAVSGLARVRLSASNAVDAMGRLQVSAQPYLRDTSFVRPSSADGLQPVYAQFVDHAGNSSAVASASIVIDTVAPSGNLTIASGPRATTAGFTDTALVVLATTANPEPNGGSVQVRLANNPANLSDAVLRPATANTAWFVDPAPDGQKTVYAVLRDAAGNESPLLTANITLDTARPNPAAATLVGGATTRATSVSLLLSSNDEAGLSPTQAVTVSESQAFSGAGTVGPVAFPSSGLLNVPLSAGDGAKTLYVRFRDGAGNDALAAPVQVLLDTTPPVAGTLAVVSPMGTGFVAAPAIALTLAAPADATQVILAEAASPAACAASDFTGKVPQVAGPLISGFTLSASQGLKRVCAQVLDAAGNASTTFSTTVTLDSNAPTGTLGIAQGPRAAAAGYTDTPQVVLTLSAGTEPAGGFVRVKLANSQAGLAAATWRPLEPSISWSLEPTPDGTRTVYAVLQDAAGNTSGELSASTILDTVGPSPASASIVGAATTSASTVLLSLSAADTNGLSPTGAVTVSESAFFTAGSTTLGPVAYPGSNQLTFTLSPGDGAKVLYVRFRDVAGNVTTSQPLSVLKDATPPAGGTLSVASYLSTGFTNSVSALVDVTFGTDASQVVLAQAASSAACAASDFTGKTPIALAPRLNFVLTTGDGLKRVCARLRDAAGNESPIFSGTVTLDTAAPAAPVILTAPATLNTPDGASFTVTTAAADPDASWLRYERIGGLTKTWTNVTGATGIAQTSFDFNLSTVSTDDDGVENVLRLRAVDKAGNTSAEAAVVITTDNNPPEPVTLDADWISNRSGAGSAFWKAGTSRDVAFYRVYYGSGSGSYNGQYASEGPSPFVTNDPDSVTLSGLQNGSTTYVSIRPVDFAGNEGAAPLGRTEVILEPNAVSLTRIAKVTTGMKRVRQLLVKDDVLYVLGAQATRTFCTTTTDAAVLQTFDIGTFHAPVRAGVIQASASQPTPVSTLVFADNIECEVGVSFGLSMATDGRFGFIATGSKVRILDLSDPLRPSTLSTVDLPGFTATGLVARGGRLIVHGVPGPPGASHVYVFKLDDLYDRDASTGITMADLVGSASNGVAGPRGLIWTRDQLLQTSDILSHAVYQLASALDPALGGGWGDAQLVGQNSPGFNTREHALLSGNYLYSAGSDFSIARINSVWAGALMTPSNVLTSYPAVEAGQFDVQGNLLFLNSSDNLGVRVLDLSNPAAPEVVGAVRSGSFWVPRAVTVYGNYLFQGNDSGELFVYEIATPNSMRRVFASSLGGTDMRLTGAFLTANGNVFDLQRGAGPWHLGGISSTGCTNAETLLDEQLLQANGTTLRVIDTAHATDRDPATTYDGADAYSVSLDAGVRATDVATYGSYVVVAEVRGGQGTFLEVFDGRPVRDGVPATALGLGNRVGTYAVTTNDGTPNDGWAGRARVTMHRGRAFVTVSGSSTGQLHVVDLRPMFDDDPATAPVAQGALTIPAVQAVAVSGGYAYVTSTNGLHVFDVSAALDELPGTVVPAGTPTSFTAMFAASAVAVHGGYVIVAPASFNPNAGLSAFDISDPLSPRLSSLAPFNLLNGSCQADDDPMPLPTRPSLVVRGSRAYVSSSQGTAIFELE